jgi:hypothetical protein
MQAITLRRRTFGANPIDRSSVGKHRDPTPHAALRRVVSMRVAPHLQKHFLRRVLREPRVTQNFEGSPVHPGYGEVVEVGKRIFSARRDVREQAAWIDGLLFDNRNSIGQMPYLPTSRGK